MGRETTTRTIRGTLLLGIVLGVTAGISVALAGERQDLTGKVLPPAVWTAPVPDVARLLTEDAARALRREGPYRVGTPILAGLSPADSGQWSVDPAGHRVWRLEVHAPRALWLVAGFDRFQPREGESLRVLDALGAPVAGPYTTEDVQPHGELWIRPVDGERLVIEWIRPAALDGLDPDLRLGTVSYGYKSWRGPASDSADGAADALGGGLGASGPCNIDVACPLGEEWQKQKRGVVKLLIGGVALCSGSLINNTSLDCKRYVLTGDHCYDLGGNAASTTFIFNFERSLCGGGQASENQFLSGSLQVARFAPSDFRLLNLPQPLPPSLTNLYFNGWSRSTAAPTETVTIHHPAGDAKKISYDDDPAVDGVFEGPNHWRVQWEEGTTEGGSSGAPLFDQNKRIVGQLHSGLAACDAQDEFDEYGKLDASWPNGLSAALDPLGTDAEALVGMDQDFCGRGNLAPRLSYASHTVDDAQGNFDGIADPGDIMKLEVRLENDGPLTASNVTATLSSPSPQVTVIDADAAWSALPPEAVENTIAPHFTVDLDPDLECGAKVPFTLSIASAEGTWQSGFDVGTGTSSGRSELVFSDDMESGTNGWVATTLAGSNAWSQTTNLSNSPTHSWFVPDVIGVSDATLRPPAIVGVPIGGILRFAHFLDTDFTGDGGVLEITIDGANWSDLGDRIVVGGYNGAISQGFGSPLAGRAAWTGPLGGWHEVEVDLSDFAGQVVLVRWRFATDSFGAGVGWYVDDVSVEAPIFDCTEPHFRLFPGALCRGYRAGSPARGAYECGQAPDRPPIGPSRQR